MSRWNRLHNTHEEGGAGETLSVELVYSLSPLRSYSGSHKWITDDGDGIPALFRPVDSSMNEIIAPLYEYDGNDSDIINGSPDSQSDMRNEIAGFKVYDPRDVAPTGYPMNLSDDFKILPATFTGSVIGYGDYHSNLPDVILIISGDDGLASSPPSLTTSILSITSHRDSGILEDVSGIVDISAKLLPLYYPNGELINNKIALYIQHRGESIPSTIQNPYMDSLIAMRMDAVFTLGSYSIYAAIGCVSIPW